MTSTWRVAGQLVAVAIWTTGCFCPPPGGPPFPGADASGVTDAASIPSDGATDADAAIPPGDANGIASDASDGAFCGDGVVDPGEACDDGNNGVQTDACLDGCIAPACGDGFLWAGVEECDDGDNGVNTDGCLVGCIAATCGDWFTWAGVEECDDGNNGVQTDGCLDGCISSTCGDGLVWAGMEMCDDGNSDSTDACVGCMAATCGDGFLWAGVETCDDGNSDPTDACVACMPATCGDGFAWAGVEECDDGNNGVETDACLDGCIAATCGDGLLWAGVEQCEDGNSVSSDACVGCIAATCGDGFAWAGVEECDDGDAAPGDGCSDTCVVEPGWSCSGEPSLCTTGVMVLVDETSMCGCVIPDCFSGPCGGTCDTGSFGTVTDTIVVTGCTIVSDIQVDVDISHTWRGDLSVELTSPAGTTVVLHDQDGWDSADDILCSYEGTCPVDGPGAISDFFGGPGNGTWTLTIHDWFKCDTGTLNSWGLSITCLI